MIRRLKHFYFWRTIIPPIEIEADCTTIVRGCEFVLAKFDCQIVGTHFLGRIIYGSKFVDEMIIYFLLILLCNLDHVYLLLRFLLGRLATNVHTAKLGIFTLFMLHHEEYSSFPGCGYLRILIHLIRNVLSGIHKFYFFLSRGSVKIGPKTVSVGS